MSIFGNLVLVALGPKLPALLSMLGSYCIIRECVCEIRRKTKRGGGSCRTLLRALVALSVADLFSSAAWFLSTWMFPSNMKDDAWGNIGSLATCNIQGFLLQLGISAGPCFNTLYAYFSLLMLRYRWRDQDLQRMEPYIHATIWIGSVGLATFPIFLELYNPFGQVCWVEAYPLDCEGDECERGGHARPYSIALSIFPVWLCIGLAAVCLYLIWKTVRDTEDRASQYSFRVAILTNRKLLASKRANNPQQQPSLATKPDGQEMPTNGTVTETSPPETERQKVVKLPSGYEVQRDRSDAVKWQAIWYLLVFMATYFLDLVVYIFLGFGLWYEGLDWFAYFIYPMQGFFNFMVFCYRRKQSDMVTWEGQTLRRLLCCPMFRPPISIASSALESKNVSSSYPTGPEQTTRLEPFEHGEFGGVSPVPR